jgi:hypothetical protein
LLAASAQVQSELTVPSSRPEDGGAPQGFEANPLTFLPGDFVSQFGITGLVVQRGQPSSAPTPARSSQGDNDNDINVGAVVGGAVGGFVGLVLIAALVAVIIVRRRRTGRVAPW